jgi:LmbE family N-acetylglucosaminyl deacetylase
MAVLGVQDHRWLGLEDGTLTGLDPRPPVARLAEIMAETRPDTILTFGPDGGTFHPDHIAICRWTGQAWAASGRPGRLLHAAMTVGHQARWGGLYEEWGIYMTDERPVAVEEDEVALALRLDNDALDQKVAALSAMHTQTASAIAALGADRYAAMNAEEFFVDAAAVAAG